MKAVAVITALLLLITGADLRAQEITKKRGKFKIYYPSGKLNAVGKVKNYHRNGKWTTYNETGTVFSIAWFVLDTVHGPYTEFYENGQVFVKGTYCKNNKCGNWNTYDSDGKMVSDENYENAQLHGQQRYWYPNGMLRDSLVTDHGVLVYRKAWHRSGKLKAIETYTHGLAEGTWVSYPEFSSDTFPEWRDEYHGGQRHGWHKAWNGGVLVQKFHYSNGALDGTSFRYDMQGRITVEENYKAGQLDGASKYYKDGELLRVDRYTNGVRDGAQEEYARQGYVMKRKWYTKAVLDSVYSYHSATRVAVIQRYEAGTTNSTWREWDEKGVYRLSGYLRNDRRHGDWCSYYENGKPHACTPYKDGQIVGTYTKWYSNGKKAIEYEILPSGEVGAVKIWNEKGVALKKGTKQYNELYEGNPPGSVFSDPRDFNRNIIERRVDDGRIEPRGIKENVEPYDPRFMEDEFLAPPDVAIERAPEDSNTVYSFCEIMPEYPGGEEARLRFIQDNLVYPENGHDVQGTVYVEYVVERDGSVSNVRVIKPIPGGGGSWFSEEAVRIVGLFPKHTPAQQNGKPVRCRVVIPIRILLR